jgi:hypothetical protein
MSKPFRPQHAPRPTKGALVQAAKQQTAKTEEAPQAQNPDVVETQQAQGQEESTVSTAPPPKAEETPAPAASKPKETGLYRLGKKYAPKTDRNSATWGKIVAVLANGPKTLKEITEEIKDHKDFLGYMTRGGHVVPYVEEAPKAE